ncbi:hypothetical protein BC941DRAFT_421463 [Chlamydoabsidia padenii]|nr:hypothetical protein BC941DRAFT_421463 [Chlamydoabsidia padenii]
MAITFILLIITTLLFLIIRSIQWLQIQHAINKKKPTTPFGAHPLATAWLQKTNLLISKSPSLLPPIVKVYLVGFIETIVTLIWKRGLLGATQCEDTEQAIDRLMVCSQRTNVRRNAIVTGADSGIGFEIARGLLVAGFHVIMLSRTLNMGTETMRQLEKLTGSSHISFYAMDLCSFDSVRSLVDQMKSIFNNGDIDVLINNAGVMNIPCTFTVDGYEAQCQTNYLSPLLLTISLLPLMNQEHGHILFASSSTLYATTHLDLRMTKTRYGFNGLDHYAYSKMCVTQLTIILGQKLVKQSSRIKVNCYHPGTVRTNLFNHTTMFNLSITRWLFDFIMLTTKEGSGTALYLVMKYLDDDTMQHENGRYWADSKPHQIPSKVTIQTPAANTYATTDMNQLWLASLEQIGLTPKDVEQHMMSTLKI